MKKNNSHSALQLWLTLASIPVLAVIAVYVYGALAFDDNAIIEIDNSLARDESNRMPEIEGADLDREFSAPLDKHINNGSLTTTHRPSMLPDLAKTNKEQSLTQMLSKKNENLQLGANGHPMLIRVQENDNLRTLAKKHLGDSVFWPYVYIVNQEKLSSPSAIKAGMTLYLPDSTFYNLTLNDSVVVKRAISLGKSLNL